MGYRGRAFVHRPDVHSHRKSPVDGAHSVPKVCGSALFVSEKSATPNVSVNAFTIIGQTELLPA